MPTVFTHAAIGYAAAKVAAEVAPQNANITDTASYESPFSSRSLVILFASMALAPLPDVDALFISVIPYNHPFGHRGFTHSLFFAAVIGTASAFILLRTGWLDRHSFWRTALLLGLVTASHGFFDAMTDGGLGVAFFAPFSQHRYFFAWRPIPVAPLSAGRLITPRGLQVFCSEAALFWTFSLGALLWNRKTTWRMVAAGACAAIGTIMWVLALKE